MELRHLRYFQAVAKELSFSKAARRLHVAQPALSRAVKELEDRIGAVLMIRNRRAVSLTEAGAVLLHEIGVLLQRVDDAVRRVQRTASGEEGELRVGFIGPPTQAFLGRLLAEFRRRYPRVCADAAHRAAACALAARTRYTRRSKASHSRRSSSVSPPSRFFSSSSSRRS